MPDEPTGLEDLDPPTHPTADELRARALARGYAAGGRPPPNGAHPPDDNPPDDDVLETQPLQFVDVEAILAGTWTPPQAEVFERSDGAGLLYRRAVNAFYGEPSHGKSLLAQLAVTQTVNDQRGALYIDYEDVPDRVIRGRLLALGALPDRLTRHLLYVDQPEAFTRTQIEDLAQRITDEDIALVVIDGVADSLTAHGLSEDSNSDIAKWNSAIPRPLARAGAAVVLVDHVVKPAPKQPRGRYARGGGAKLAGIDGVAYMIEGGDAPSPKTEGTVSLVISKDRHGGVGRRGETVARVRFTPSDEGILATDVQVPRFGGPNTDDPAVPAGTRPLTEEALNAVEAAVTGCIDEGNIEGGAPGPSTRRVLDQLRSGTRAQRFPLNDKAVRGALLTLTRAKRIVHTTRTRGGDYWTPRDHQAELDLEAPDDDTGLED